MNSLQLKNFGLTSLNLNVDRKSKDKGSLQNIPFNPKYKWNLYNWQNQHKNLHFTYKSIVLREILKHFLSKRGFHLNLFYLQKYHGHLSLSAQFFSFYIPKLVKVFRNLSSYKLKKKQKSLKLSQKKKNIAGSEVWNGVLRNNIFRSLKRNNRQLSKNKTFDLLAEAKVQKRSLENIAKACMNVSSSPSLYLKIWKKTLPKTYILDQAQSAFSRFKNNIHFWSGLQSLRLVVDGKGSSQLLASYVAIGVRRNRKRVAFIIYLKRIIDWHFKASEDLQIQGIRIETKGRFNAKSRCRKYILSVGRVAKGEKTSNVDYTFTETYTVFGSLGIKVWVCPNI